MRSQKLKMGLNNGLTLGLTAFTFIASASTSLAQEFSWLQSPVPGQQAGATPMIPVDQGFCYFTKIQGHFAGGGESVSIREFNGRWELTGTSQQNDVGATARCVRYSELMSLSPLTRANVSGELGIQPVKGAPEQTIDIGPASQNFCFLTRVQGRFEGGGERVQFVTEGGTVKLRGAALQDGVAANGRCLVYPRAEQGLLPRLPLNFSATQPGQTRPGSFDLQIANVPMLRLGTSICALTGMTGRFQGGGEQIQILNDGTSHVLNVRSQQVDVGSSASCALLRLNPSAYIN